MPGAHLTGVHLLRNIADVERIRGDLASEARLVIVGAGYIGLEVAATAREMGLDVTVLEQAERVMSRVTCSAVSSFYLDERSRRECTSTAALKCNPSEGDSQREGRSCAMTAPPTAADVVLVGIGVSAQDELARDAGLEAGSASTSTSTAAPPTRMSSRPVTARRYPDGLRAARSAGVRRQRLRAGHERRAEHARHPHTSRQGALVLVGPV